MERKLNEEQTKALEVLLKDISKDQLSFLQGFIGGVSYIKTHLETQKENVTKEEISILYATNTGNSKAIAESLYHKLLSSNFKVRLLSLAQYNKSDLKKEKFLILIISTQGNGVPPVQALDFFDFIRSKRMPELKNTRYSVLALGDSSYKKFCFTGIQADDIFSAKGAKAILPIQKLDADFKSDSVLWIDSLSEKLLSINLPINNIANKVDVSTEEYYSEKPFVSEIIGIRKITTDKSISNVYHVEIAIEKSNIKYQAGDYLAISTSKYSKQESDYNYFPITSGIYSDLDEIHFTIEDNLANKKVISEINKALDLSVYIKINKSFHLPTDIKAPVLMLAVGSGVTIYNSFLQAMKNKYIETNNILLFVNRSFKDDFLYQTNFQKFLQLKILSFMDVEFSLKEQYYLKITDVIRRNSTKIYHLLESKGVVYISSSQEYSAIVENSIYEIIISESGLGINDSKRYFQKLKSDNRIRINNLV